MDEEVILDLFNRATSQGYTKSIDQFRVLIANDQEVLDDNYEYVTSKGYSKSIDEFKKLVGAGTVTQEDDSILEKDLAFQTTENPTTKTPTQEEIPLEVPEVLESKVESTITDSSPEQEGIGVADKKEFLTERNVDVDALFKQAKFGNPSTGQGGDFIGDENEFIESFYNEYVLEKGTGQMQTNLSSGNLTLAEQRDASEGYATDVNTNILEGVQINKDDYLAWEEESQREESATFKFVTTLFTTSTSDTFNKEKKDFEKVASYKASLLNKLNEDINLVSTKIELAKNPQDLIQLQNIKKQLEAKYMSELQQINKLANYFPTLKKYTQDRDLARRKKIYEASNSDDPNKPNEITNEVGNVFKAVPVVLADFVMNSLAFITSGADQVLYALPVLELEQKGLLAGLTERFLNAAESVEQFVDPVQRSGVIDGKAVTVNGKEYIVTYDNVVLDRKSHVRLDGIISEEEIKEVLSRSKKIRNSQQFYDGGGLANSAVTTGFNLFALIRGGKFISKTLKVSPGVGMGLASYGSTMASEVDSMRADLVAAGMTEKEAMSRAIIAGNAIASLDGIFSGLAGGNQKILGSLSGFRQQVINIVKKDGAKFSKDQFKQKLKDLGVEMSKELFVEELPVLFSGKAVNAVVNYSVGREVRSSSVPMAEIIETAIMTLAATGGLGAKNTFFNKQTRLDALRFVAGNVNDLKKTLDGLETEGSITKEEADKTYQDVYNMQAAELQTKGTIINTENMLEAADLLRQRLQLMSQRDGLEGPLKEDIDKRIEDVDEQIRTLKESDKSKTETETVTYEFAKEKLKEENKVRLKAGAPAILESEANIIKKQNELIKDQKDAIQKPSTEKVPAQKSPGDSQKVGEGDSVEVVASESNAQNQNENQTQKEEITSKERVVKIADDIVKKTRGRNKRKGNKNNPKLEAENAIKYLQQSKAFNDGSLSDAETEAIVVELNKKLGVDIKPPTVKKLLGIKRGGKPALIKVKNDFAAYKKQLKADEKLQSDQKKDTKEKRITLSNVLTGLKKAGVINLVKFDILQKKINKLDVYNARDLQSVTDYVEKVINDANAAKKIKDADALRKKIKKDAKKPNISANVSIAAKEFAKIDPNMVEDIDVYLEQASILLDGLKPTKKTTKGLKVARGVNIKNTNDYSSKELDSQQEKVYKAQRILFQQLTGLNSNEFTMLEMKKMLNDIKGNDETSDPVEEEKAKVKNNVIEKGLKNAFEKVKRDIKEIIDNAIDPLTGDSVKLTKTKKDLAIDFLNMDLSIIKDPKVKIEALDALINFATNQDTGGMNAVLQKYRGLEGMVEVNEKGYVSTALKSLFGGSKSIARWWNKNLGALPTTIEKMFNSPGKAKFVMQKMGLTGLIEGANKATTEANILIKDYAKKVKKLKMKSGIYFDEKNSIERGIFAEMRKTIPGSEQDIENEFKRSKDLIKETYEVLEKQDDKDLKREGEIIKEIYDKILKDSNNINEVQSKVDPANAYGVRYFTDIWASNYDQLAEVSLNVYNANLGKDINYTPTSYRRVSFEEVVPEIGARVFNPLEDKKSAYDEKTGVLKPAKRPRALPGVNEKGKKVTTRVLNLGFDQNNTSQLEKALIDIYTAPSIKRIEGARSSEYYDDIFPTVADRELMDKRINLLVDKKRGVSDRVSPSDKRFLNRMNKIATFGVARVLGGVFQPIKQSIVLANAMIVGGPINVAKALKLMMLNPEVEKAVMNSGQAIANRGLDAQADIETNSMKIKNQQASNFEKGIEKLDDVGKWWLSNTLVKPDVFSARASWVGFYLQAMNKKGVKSNEIDWTQPLDKEAARDAQYELDRQQNVSDADLMGELFSSGDLWPQLTRKTLFPFATFLINQKNRMYSDVLIIKNPTSLPGETSKAARSLAGLAVETATFNVVGYQITQALAALAGSVFGEDEEEKEKRKGFQKIGRLGLAISDIASPIPLLDDQVIGVVNNVISTISSDEDPVQFYQNEKTFIEYMGTLGIGYTKAKNLYEMVKAGFSGKVTSEYRGVKTDKNITQEAQNVMKTTSLLYFLYIMGYLPAETGYVTERVLKQAKKEKETVKKPIIFKPKKKRKTVKVSSGLPPSPFGKNQKSSFPKSPF